MAAVSSAFNVPINDGNGTALDISGFAASKRALLVGSSGNSSYYLDISNDGSTFTPFRKLSEGMNELYFAANYARIRRDGWISGDTTPTIALLGQPGEVVDYVLADSTQQTIQNLNGLKTLLVTGTFTGYVLVEVRGPAVSISSWVTLTAYALGDQVTNGGKVYQCTTAGTSGATGPTGQGTTITDGSAVWRWLSNGSPSTWVTLAKLQAGVYSFEGDYQAIRRTLSQSLSGTATVSIAGETEDSGSASADTGQYYVDSFGAIGDGVTDDRSSIQAAIDQCALDGGGEVILTPGKTYVLGASLTILNTPSLQVAGVGFLQKNVHLTSRVPGSWGGNSTLPQLLWGGNSTDPMLKLHSRECKVSNLLFYAAAAAPCNRAIDLNYPGADLVVPTHVQGNASPYSNITIENVSIFERFTYGIVIGDEIGGAGNYANNGENLKLKDVFIQGSASHTMTACCHIPNTTGQIKHLWIENCPWSPTGGTSAAGVGLNIAGRASGTMIGNGPSYCEYGVVMGSYTADYWNFISIDSEGCAAFCYFVNGTTAGMQLSFHSCRFSLANIVADGRYMWFIGTYEVLLEGCTFQAQPAARPMVIQTSQNNQSTRLTIRHCTLMNATETLVEEPSGQPDYAGLVFEQNDYTDPTTGTWSLFEDFNGPAAWFSPKLITPNSGASLRRVIGQLSIRHLASAVADADLSAADLAFYRDEATHKLHVKVKYADGTTVKVGEIALA